MARRTLSAERLDHLLSSECGLTPPEIEQRRARFGTNDVLETPPSTWRDLARETARDPMLWFLLGTSALFVALGDYVESAIMALAIAPLIGMDAYLHRRTQASTSGLASRLASTARVVRDGAVVEVPARELVVGDLVWVAAGEAFPADGLILSGTELQADESTLTGEAYPVRKRPIDPRAPHRESFEDAHWGFAGTRLLTGPAQLRVGYTGRDTLYGEIVRSAQAGTHARTPLQIAVANLVAGVLVVALITCVILALIRIRQGHGWMDAALSAATLAIAALPEEFPVVFSFFLGVGVYRLARRHALVRRAVAVEAIGRVSCICSDKTGTLTEGRLVLSQRLPAPDVSDERLIELAALAARPDSGDPLDAALTEITASIDRRETLAVFPFTEDRRRETAVVRQSDGACLAVVKGAPETVLKLCALDNAALRAWREQIATYASMGHKVIGCAHQPLEEKGFRGGEPDRGYTWAGLLIFEDPVRTGVRDAVQACLHAGIRVVMLTGDHPATALAIAREVGLASSSTTAIDAEELREAPDATRASAWQRAEVIARAIPSQKLEIVRALQAQGDTVAVTGDGVNDVPALQAADIGIAMGERGTRSAREVAAIVLLDDNFRTIVDAIAEGRQLFRNLQLSFAYLLLVHIPLVLSAAIIPLAGYPLLYLPMHIVWLELIIHPTALLVFQDLPSSGPLRRASSRAPQRFFGAWTQLGIGLVGLLVTVAIWWGYDYALGLDRDVNHARTIALSTLIVASAAMTAGLSGMRTRTSWVVVVGSVSSLVLVAQVEPLARLAHLAPLHLPDWSITLGSAAAAGLGAGLIARAFRGQRSGAR